MSGQTVVYGSFDPQTYLVFILEEEAHELAEVYTALHASETWGDLRRRVSQTRYQEAVDQVTDGEPDEPPPADDDPFSLDQLGRLQDGDWPEFAAQTALRWLSPEVQALGDRTGNRINGDWLEFPPEREAEIVAALEREGYLVRLDPALVSGALGANSSDS